MIIAAFEKMEELEDNWLAQKARETLKKIESGEEKVHDFNKLKNSKLSKTLRDRLEINDTLPEEKNDSDLEDFSLEKCISYFQTIPKELGINKCYIWTARKLLRLNDRK